MLIKNTYFGPAGGWRTLNKQQLHDLQFASNAITVKKQVTHVGEENCIAYSAFVGSMKERDHLEDVGVDWRIILKSLLKE
jgi:hypothetical protein